MRHFAIHAQVKVLAFPVSAYRFSMNDKMIIETIIHLFDLTDTAVIESTNEKADLTLMPITGNVYSVAGGKYFS